MFRSLFALMLVLVVTALPVQAQPRQPSPIRFVQSSSGALFLTQEPSAWPLIPDQISDDDLAALTPRSQTNVLPVDPLFRPEPRQRVVQGSDGTLYDIIDGDANTDGVWPLVPDQISDTDLASLSLGSEIDGTIPPGLATNNALSDTVPATAAPVGSLPTQTTSQQQAPAPPVNEGDADTSTPAAPTAPGQPSPVASDGFDYSGATDYGCPGATARIELNQPGTGVITSEQARTWSGNTAEGFPGRYAITLLGHTQYKITATMTPAPGTPSIQLLHLGAFGPHALTSGQWSCSYNTQLTSRVVCISDASVSFSCTFTTDLPGTYVIGVAIEPLGFHQQPGAPKFPSELPYTVTVVNQAPGSTQAPTPTASTTAQGDWLALCANDNFWQGIPNLKTVEVGETISPEQLPRHAARSDLV